MITKKIVSCDDIITIGKINFFFNKNFLKYAQLLKRITAVVVAAIVLTTASRLWVRLSNNRAANHGCGCNYSIHHQFSISRPHLQQHYDVGSDVGGDLGENIAEIWNADIPNCWNTRVPNTIIIIILNTISIVGLAVFQVRLL